MMTNKIFGMVCGFVGVGFILQEVYFMSMFGMPGNSTADSGFYIILGTCIVLLAMVILFYNNKEDD